MDFSALEIEENKADFWVHLAVDERPLYWDGKSVSFIESETPCRVKMRSASSNEVYVAFNKYQAAENAHKLRVGRAKDGEIDSLAAKHLEKSGDLIDALLVAAIMDWENIYFDGKAEKVTADLIRSLIDRNANHAKRAIRGQLFTAITEKRENLTDAA